MNHKKSTIKFINLFRTIAIDTNFVLYLPEYEKSIKIINKKEIFGTLEYRDSLQKIKIEINEIKLKKVANTIFYDSITYFDLAKHLTKYRSYKGIDYRFNFSKIIFNKKRTRAIVRYLQRYEDRFPHNSGLFLLAKENGKWKIIDGYRFISY
jgi:hypothetical protein